MLPSLSVQDWCVAAQVVTAGGSAGLLWHPVGQYAGQPHGATTRLGLYSHTFWPHGVPAPANTHARLRPSAGGECLCLPYCTHVVWSTFNDEDLFIMWNIFFIVDIFLSCFSLVLQSTPSPSFVMCLLGFCLSSGEVGVSFSARFKCPGAEEHAWNSALLFPLC